MSQSRIVSVKRSPADRRSPVDRRVINIGPEYPPSEKRMVFKDRRSGWEDRFGWERISRWTSSPIYTDLP